jgi:ribonucleoside-triphosphate reductase
MDHPIMSGRAGEGVLQMWLETLKEEAIKTNETYADKLGIPRSTAITCVKPSGTVSQLVGCSSGIHSSYAPYYIRRVRNDRKDPLCQALIDAGVPWEESTTNSNEIIFSFPCVGNGGRGVLLGEHETALSQLRIWQLYNRYWCEHKPSCTIYVQESEWLDVAAWVYKNFDEVSGISFFPKNNHVYKQAPYEEISEEKYNEMVSKFPTSVEFNVPENYDSTTASQELACVGNQCEIS